MYHYIVVFCIIIVLYLGQYGIPLSSLARTLVERSILVYRTTMGMKESRCIIALIGSSILRLRIRAGGVIL
jgi:hypothetical protein